MGSPLRTYFFSFCIQPASEWQRTNKSSGDRGPSPQRLASSVPRNVGLRGKQDRELSHPLPTLLLLISLAALLDSPRGPRARGLRMTVITAQGSS